MTEDFIVTDAIIDDFLDFARSKDIEFVQTDVDSSRTWISTELEANIVGRKLGDVAQYKIAIQDDTQMQEALSYFDRFNTLDEMFDYAATLKEHDPKVVDSEK
ncbi:MAG TPA: hypothetical protein PLD62_07870 [Candidatus Cloacimonadota bacterium]|nr:hypothetical protein [Candidatus Cloacimonadota bacterium]